MSAGPGGDGVGRLPRALALESSTSVGSVALGWGSRILAGRVLPEQGRHAASILPAIRELLDESGVELSELAGVVVGAGPGSFTGVRVAAATARGLVRGAGLPLVPVSSLAAAAVGTGVGSGDGTAEGPLCVCFDARADRVFAADYRWEGTRLVEVTPPRATRIPELLAQGRPPGSRFAGDGAWRHGPTLEAAGYVVLPPPAGVPGAAGLLALATADGGAAWRVEPHPTPGEWEPDYQKDGRPVVSGP